MRKFTVHFRNKQKWWVKPFIYTVVALHVLCDHEIKWATIGDWVINLGGVESEWWYS